MNGRTNVNVRNTVFRIGTAVVDDIDMQEILPADVGYDYFDRVDVTINTSNYLLDMCLHNPFNFSTNEVGTRITEIPPYLLYGMSSLGTVNIPTSVTGIGAHAFDGTGMTGLTAVSTNLTTLGTDAFANNDSLREVNMSLPSVTACPRMFSGCRFITSMDIHSLPIVDQYCFYNTPRLVQLHLPADCAQVKQYAFDLSNDQYYAALNTFYVWFHRHGEWAADGTEITPVTQFGNRVFGQRATSRTGVNVPLDSVGGYWAALKANTYNGQMTVSMRGFADYAANVTLPSSITQRVQNKEYVFDLTWYNSHIISGANQLADNTTPSAGRYYAALVLSSETTL